MKFQAPAEPPGSHRPADSRTRDEVARLLLESGPATATALAQRLGISLPAVRKHLDALVAEGLVRSRERRPLGPRGRGRPAKVFALTERGRECFPHAYDDLAAAALRQLAEVGGTAALEDFATRRVASLVERHREEVAAVAEPRHRLVALASALTSEGFATNVQFLPLGGQLCQHHCPVTHVAEEFPQLCEAETRAFGQLLGTHVQRLATIARGDGVCTTHVPAAAATEAAPRERDIADPPGADPSPDTPDTRRQST